MEMIVGKAGNAAGNSDLISSGAAGQRTGKTGEKARRQTLVVLQDNSFIVSIWQFSGHGGLITGFWQSGNHHAGAATGVHECGGTVKESAFRCIATGV
jgi:hypothetical protein